MTCDSAYRLHSYALSRPNVVSVLIGYRFLEKFMFSFQTLHVLCEVRNFLPKYGPQCVPLPKLSRNKKICSARHSKHTPGH